MSLAFFNQRRRIAKMKAEKAMTETVKTKETTETVAEKPTEPKKKRGAK